MNTENIKHPRPSGYRLLLPGEITRATDLVSLKKNPLLFLGGVGNGYQLADMNAIVSAGDSVAYYRKLENRDIKHPCPEGYRLLLPGETAKPGDLRNAKDNRTAFDGIVGPGRGEHGFIPVYGDTTEVTEHDSLAFYRKIEQPPMNPVYLNAEQVREFYDFLSSQNLSLEKRLRTAGELKRILIGSQSHLQVKTEDRLHVINQKLQWLSNRISEVASAADRRLDNLENANRRIGGQQ